MRHEELRSVLESLGLRQNQLAALLGVTTRAVSMWVNSEREIPGAVTAYIKLLSSLPKALYFKEIKRIQGESEMLNGMYKIDYVGDAGFGAATLIAEDGILYGLDVAGMLYDGIYEPTGNPGEVVMALTLTVPPNAPMVQGVTSHEGFSFKIAQKINLLNSDEFSVVTPINPPHNIVTARVYKLRNLPN